MQFTSIFLKYFNITEPQIRCSFCTIPQSSDTRQGQLILKTKISRILKNTSAATFLSLDSASTADTECVLQHLHSRLPSVSIINTDSLCAYSAGGVPILQLYHQNGAKWFQAVHLLIIFSRLDQQVAATGPCILESSLQSTERTILNNLQGDCELLCNVIIQCRRLFLPHAVFALPNTNTIRAAHPLDFLTSYEDFFLRLEKFSLIRPASLNDSLTEIVDELNMVPRRRQKRPTKPARIAECLSVCIFTFLSSLITLHVFNNIIKKIV